MTHSVWTMLKRWLGRAWYRSFEMLHRPRVMASHPSILLIRADGIGDLVFALPLLEAIRRHEAPRRTVLLCDQGAESLIRSLGIVDEIIPFERLRYRRGPFYRWKMWSILRRVRAEKAVSLQYHRSPTSDELLAASAAPQRIAFNGNTELIAESDRRHFNRHFTQIIEVAEHVRERDRYDGLVEASGWPAIEWERTYQLPLRSTPRPPRDREAAEHRSIVALAPGGSSAVRRWPEERWIELAQRLSASGDVKCLLVGGPPDRPLIERLAERIGTTATVVIGGNVLEVANTIEQADVVVGIDSGISHVSARFGVPTIVVLGGGHVVRYFPYGSASTCIARQDCYECNWQCHRDRVYCLTEISVEAVEREVRRRRTAAGRRPHV